MNEMQQPEPLTPEELDRLAERVRLASTISRLTRSAFWALLAEKARPL